MRARRRDIAFYAPWAGSIIAPRAEPSGGAEVQILHLARGLAGRGARVALLTYAVDGLPVATDGVEVLAQHRPAGGPQLLRRAAIVARSAWLLARLDANVVVQRGAGGTTGLVALAARISRTRFVYSSASTIDFSFDARQQGRTAAAMFVLGVRLADELVVQTDEQAALCRERFGRAATVIRSVAERPATPLPADGTASDGFLWVGRMADYKNPDAFLDLAAAVPEAPFTMVGIPADSDDAAALARRAAGLANVQLLGPQPRATLLDRMARATAIVSTSDFEGMPNTLLEGWSRGVPALTLNHDPDGIIGRERLGDCAGGDPDRLVAATRALWTGRQADAALRTRCRDYVRTHHDPDVVVAQWAEVLGVRSPSAPDAVA